MNILKTLASILLVTVLLGCTKENPEDYFEEAEFLGQPINKLQKFIGTPFMDQKKWEGCEDGKKCEYYFQGHGGTSCFVYNWHAGTVDGKIEMIKREYYSRCGVDKYPTALKLLTDKKPKAIINFPKRPKVELGNQVVLYYEMENALASVVAICPPKPYGGSDKVKISLCVIGTIKTFLCGPKNGIKDCVFNDPDYKPGQYDLEFDI